QMIDERDRLVGRRIAVDDREQPLIRLGALPQLGARVALGRLMEMNLPERLVHGDSHEQLAEVVLLLQAKPARLEPAEERAKDRWTDVFGIARAGEPLADSPARQGDEPLHITIEKLTAGVLVAAAAALGQLARVHGLSHPVPPGR